MYPNANWSDIELVDYVKANLRRGGDIDIRPSERPWNDPGPGRGVDVAELVAENERKPDLRAIVLDFSGVYVVPPEVVLIFGMADIPHL